MLVRIPVRDQRDVLRRDVAVVEQRVALGRGTVGRHALRFAFGPGEEFEERSPAGLHAFGKAVIGGELAQPGLRLLRPQAAQRGALRALATGMRREDTQRSAVGRQLLGVVQAQLVSSKQVLDGGER